MHVLLQKRVLQQFMVGVSLGSGPQQLKHLFGPFVTRVKPSSTKIFSPGLISSEAKTPYTSLLGVEDRGDMVLDLAAFNVAFSSEIQEFGIDRIEDLITAS